MIVTLAWKEVREHQAIWLTMIIMTVLMGSGLAKLIATGDPALAVGVAALTLLGMSAAYGVVCGSMMFAGEHEGGTLVFLDIFLGRRGLLWFGKCAIGIVLVLTQALAVALAMRLLRQDSPGWILALVGDPRADALIGRLVNADRNVWFLILPVVALEAYAWGLLGSSLTQRVLAGATVAALGATPIWLIAIVAPPQVFLVVRLVATGIILAFSYANFRSQSHDPTPGPAAEPDGPRERKDRFLDVWKEFDHDDVISNGQPAHDERVPVGSSMPSIDRIDDPPAPIEEPPGACAREQAKSPGEVLWWLTLQQAWTPLCVLVAVSLATGLLLAANAQVLWPLATLLLGVACGVAAFAPEQRDLAYEFLAAQHLPLRMIWRFKIFFWLATAVLAAFVLLFVHFLTQMLRQRPLGPNDGFDGTLPRLLGPTLFFSVWLAYGFGAGQVVVWLCRKNILAILVSLLVAASALGLWLPSLLCGGMSGWQVWLAPLAVLLATWFLMRAWAGGRIKERMPVTALVGFGSAVTLWALLHFGLRAWEFPDVGAPLDPIAFRASVPLGDDNAAGKAIERATTFFDDPNDRNDRWLQFLAEAARLPVGVLERPRLDGQQLLLKHLPTCRLMTNDLLRRARASEPGPALEHLVQALGLSRNLRHKAPIESYLTGVEAEGSAMRGLVEWLVRAKPSRDQVRQALVELNRHAAQTPTPLDCLQTECFRSGGLLANPNAWTLAAPGAVERMPEQWLAGGIAMSLEVPWEAERKARLWQLVWAGLFRAIETPHWQLPPPAVELPARKTQTRAILKAWLPATEGRGAELTRTEMARLVDASWLADETLFCDLIPLREAAIRARWRVDGMRQMIALSLYRIDEGMPARALEDLIPKYLPTGLPLDPYSGQPFRYRSELENEGKAIIWSTGPDRIDHGGRKDGGHLADADPQWLRGDFDLMMTAP